ncbi:hypothetical protein M441DRAFT_450016 [Trichoderma asperellum CBS 433.97]|uniref:Uncharacterized protein n=1 Tax=Trichoderma asperellum (strain ATCC 204424 / CBS 433.97 / NBRC 101777) TaxID=1042311 RepID=A0A2T3YTV4_TRIA4|nr:hypothetical protein M441DRAFT_450016 [Trichoderma asperellum CBS 433.97]PTB35995.1 hypothetical protein M441DRAFT_450016 [Trichoderma asperellum CBS 433.97]
MLSPAVVPAHRGRRKNSFQCCGSEAPRALLRRCHWSLFFFFFFCFLFLFPSYLEMRREERDTLLCYYYHAPTCTLALTGCVEPAPVEDRSI